MAAVPETRADRPLHSRRRDPYRPDVETLLAPLRSAFPQWGIIHDPFTGLWIAVRGRTRIEVAPTAAALYERLESSDVAGGGSSQFRA